MASTGVISRFFIYNFRSMPFLCRGFIPISRLFPDLYVMMFIGKAGEPLLEKTLQEILISLASKSPYRINEYFAVEFTDDYERLEKNRENKPILEFLNESFFDIDVEYDGSSKMDEIIIDTLRKAIRLCGEK